MDWNKHKTNIVINIDFGPEVYIYVLILKSQFWTIFSFTQGSIKYLIGMRYFINKLTSYYW